MAREKSSTKPKKKRENRLKQVWTVYRMTAKRDRTLTPIILALLILPTVLAVALTIIFEQPWFFIVLWAIAAFMAGLLVALIVLGRKAEVAAYMQIENSPGAVGSMIKTSLRRGWIGEEMPVAFNARTQDMVFRVVGRGGVVLLTDGPIERTRPLAEEEKRKLSRILPNVPISILSVGTGEGQVRLFKVSSALGKVKPVLTRAEVQIVNNRVSSLGTKLPIPKGIDPTKVRMSHKR